MATDNQTQATFSKEELQKLYSVAVNAHRQIALSKSNEVELAAAYQMSSFVASLCLELANGLQDSTGANFNMRGILEDIALVRYFENKPLGSPERAIFRLTPAIMEYSHFSKGRCAKVESIEEYLVTAKSRYDNAKIDIKKLTGWDEEKTESFCQHARLPFTLDPNVNYEEFVRQYYPPETKVILDYLYQSASQNVHPNNKDTKQPVNAILPSLFLHAFSPIIHHILDSYVNPQLRYPMMDEKRLYSDQRFAERIPSYENTKKKAEVLKDLAAAMDNAFSLNKGTHDPLANLFSELADCEKDFALDQLNDLGSETTMKFKAVLEQIATFIVSGFGSLKGPIGTLKMNLYTLSSGYKNWQTLIKLEEKNNDAQTRFINIVDASLQGDFQLYRHDYPDSSITLKSFRKAILGQTFGWTIDGKGHCLSPTELIDAYLANTDYRLAAKPQADEEVRNDMAFEYQFSQISTHANGYIFLPSNIGIFNPFNIDLMLDYAILSVISTYTSAYGQDWPKAPTYKPLYERFRKDDHTYAELMNELMN
jgi:hypothetical protein